MHPPRRTALSLCLVALAAAATACSSRTQAPPSHSADSGQRTATPESQPFDPTIAPPAVPERVDTLGSSVEGRPVLLHLFGDSGSPGETVLIFGGIHGSEPTSAGVCRELLAVLRRSPELSAGRRVAVIPEANPDGLARKMRTNANLVDVNRNFPAKNWKRTRRSNFFGGDKAADQPETAYLMAAVDRLLPTRIVAVHSMDEPCNNYDGPGERLAKLMAAANGYPIKASIGYPTPGSFGSWAGGDRQIPVITLELPQSGTTAKSWAKNRDALVAFIKGA